MMKRRLITALMGAVCLFLGNISKANTIQLYPTNDAYIDSAQPGTVHNGSTLNIGYISGRTTRSYLKFDLSAIPDGQSIVSATLRLDAISRSTTQPVVGAFYLENDSWYESTLTWNNAPTDFSFLPINTQPIDIGDVFWAVKNDVVSAYGDDDIYSVVMKLTHEVEIFDMEASFYSKDSGTPGASPYLAIEYVPIPEPATLLFLGLGGLILAKRKA